MLFAGHETTASTLAATLAFLAANPAEQAIVYNEIQQFVQSTGTNNLTFDQYDSLPKVRAAFVEALRMIPAGSLLIREAREDGVLRASVPFPQTPNLTSGEKPNGGFMEKPIPIVKGTLMIGDMIGVRKYRLISSNTTLSYYISNLRCYHQNTTLGTLPSLSNTALLAGTT